VPEARLEDSGSGFAPAGEGWFVVDVRDAEWWDSKAFGSGTGFENKRAEFPQVGTNRAVLEPGHSNCLAHSEWQEEAFLVLQAYAPFERAQQGRPPYWDELPWS